MTTIKVRGRKIEVQGHSGYEEKGKDIVCAAISMLTESTYNYLIATGNILKKVESDGYFFMEIEVINAYGKNILKSFTKMIDDLIAQYPNYVERI